MKTFTHRIALLVILIGFINFGFAQEAAWVEQVIVANGNKFETSPPFQDFVTVQSYNPGTGVSTTFDEIKTHSVQDVIIENERIYVAAQDSLVVYDANTLQRVNAIADSGLSRLYIFENWLIISKQYPIERFYVEVLNANDLSLVARIQNIPGDCKGITSTKDSIYVALYGDFMATEGKIAVIDYNTWTYQRSIDLGPNAVGINDIYNYGNNLFSVNETPYGAADQGSITAYDTYMGSYINYVYNRKIGANSSLSKNSGIIDNLLYLTYQYGIRAFNLDTRQLQDTNIFGDPGSGNHIYYTSYDADYIDNRLYLNIGNQVSWGINVVGSMTGDSITSFAIGFNSEALAIDYRTPVAVPESESLRIKYARVGTVQAITIRDISGKTIFSEEIHDHQATWINCANFPSGLYLITVETTQGIYSTKMLKK